MITLTTTIGLLPVAMLLSLEESSGVSRLTRLTNTGPGAPDGCSQTDSASSAESWGMAANGLNGEYRLAAPDNERMPRAETGL